MTALDIGAALDAINRLDDGHGQPGDEQLAAAYDRHAQHVYDRAAEQAHADWEAMRPGIWAAGGELRGDES